MMRHEPDSDLAERLRKKILRSLLVTKGCALIQAENIKTNYSAKELMEVVDTNEFIHRSYQIVLGREPTPQCLEQQRISLLEDKTDRAYWLSCLLKSEEGQNHDSELLGLSWYLAEWQVKQLRRKTMRRLSNSASLFATIRRVLRLPEAFQLFAEELDTKRANEKEDNARTLMSIEERFLILEAEIVKLRQQLETVELKRLSEETTQSSTMIR